MSTINIIISERWANEILFNNKRIEYRDVKPFYTNKIEGKDITHVLFHVGYSKNPVKFICECLDLIEVDEINEETKEIVKYYEFHLSDPILK